MKIGFKTTPLFRIILIFDHQSLQPNHIMKKFRFTIASLMIVGFLSATLFTSCGGKKEEAAEETTEHPAEGGDHPSGGEHPSADTTATDSAAAQ
jgi:hypothetical protein